MTFSFLFCYYLQGMGDSAQGFANGVFFALLTPTVRYRLVNLFSKCFCCCCSKRLHGSNRNSQFTSSIISYKRSSSFDPATYKDIKQIITKERSNSLSNVSADIDYESLEDLCAKGNLLIFDKS